MKRLIISLLVLMCVGCQPSTEKPRYEVFTGKMVAKLSIEGDHPYLYVVTIRGHRYYATFVGNFHYSIGPEVPDDVVFDYE